MRSCYLIQLIEPFSCDSELLEASHIITYRYRYHLKNCSSVASTTHDGMFSYSPAVFLAALAYKHTQLRLSAHHFAENHLQIGQLIGEIFQNKEPPSNMLVHYMGFLKSLYVCTIGRANSGSKVITTWGTQGLPHPLLKVRIIVGVTSVRHIIGGPTSSMSSSLG